MRCTRLAGNTRRKNDAKNHHLGTIAQFCWAVSSQLRHVSKIGKKLLRSNTSSTCPHNMVNFGPLTAEISSGVWGTPANFNGFPILAALLHGNTSGRQPNFAALNRGCHLYSARRPSRLALVHILVIYVLRGWKFLVTLRYSITFCVKMVKSAKSYQRILFEVTFFEVFMSIKLHIQFQSYTNHTLGGCCKLYSRVTSDKKLTRTKPKSHKVVDVSFAVLFSVSCFKGVASVCLDGLPFLALPFRSSTSFFLLIIFTADYKTEENNNSVSICITRLVAANECIKTFNNAKLPQNYYHHNVNNLVYKN